MQIDRKKYGKAVKRDGTGPCFDAYELTPNDIGSVLPFVGDKFRVGVGGDTLSVLPLNSNEPVTFKNVADGEVFDLCIVAVLLTDCDNIVIML